MGLLNITTLPMVAGTGMLAFKILLSLITLFSLITFVLLAVGVGFFLHSYYTGKSLPKLMARLLQ